MLKITTSLLLIAVSFNIQSSNNVILLEGSYQGKNIYVLNPFTSVGVGFCTVQIEVNGEVSTDEINSSAFEIDLASYNLKKGEEIVVRILHKKDCKPKVLTPQLNPRSTYKILDIGISEKGILSWSTTSETSKIPFEIEQYKWNKWVKIGEMDGLGKADTNHYSFAVIMHSGENIFRVKQDDQGVGRNSKSIKTSNPIGRCKVIKSTRNKIGFTYETQYELYDSFGNIVKIGFGNSFNTKHLKRGIYYLNYDNKYEKIKL
jgi:hypothetical protein